MALRGESARALEFADLFCVDLEGEGHGECKALIAILSQGKTNQVGRLKFGACIGNKAVRTCGIKALALYMLNRLHMEGENVPDFSKPQNWYEIKILRSCSGNQTKAMVHKPQYNTIDECLIACGLMSKAKTHCKRGSSVRMAERKGVPEFHLRQLGRWNSTAMGKCFLTQLPRYAMRALAKFDAIDLSYFLPRDVEVTPELEFMVFLGLKIGLNSELL